MSNPCVLRVSGALVRLISGTAPAAILLAVVAAAPAQPTLTNLNTLSGGNFSYANAISADGLVVCGSSTSSGGQRAFRWTEAGGMVSLSALPGFTNYSVATAINADGSVIAGISSGGNNTARGFRWTAATGLQSTSVLGTGSASYARAVSGDGSVIAGGSYTAGLTGFTATRWTSGLGLQTLGGEGSYGVAISADGSVIVGTGSLNGDLRAFRWTSVGGIQYLDIPVGAIGSDGSATSADGSAVAGYVTGPIDDTTFFTHAFLWTGLPVPGGDMRDLGVLDGSEAAYAWAISGNGSVVGGVCDSPGGQRAFIWTASLGMVDLNTYLPSVGVNLTGWTLNAVRGISADGSAIVGEGDFNGALRAFLVRGLSVACPTACIADFNCSGDVSVQDIFDFLNAYFTADLRADFSHDGIVGVQDIFEFLGVWFAGC